MKELLLRIFVALPLIIGTLSYPNGAPPGICSLDKVPNHNSLSAQTSPPPYDLFMSKDQVTSMEDSIIVTIQSTSSGPTFKGFLIQAVDKTGAPVGTWENDDQSHPLTGCAATTHDKNTEKHQVKLTWKPQGQLPNGPISMKGVVVQRFDLFWTNIPVIVKSSGQTSIQKPVSQPTETPAQSSTNKNLISSPKGGIPLPGLNKPAKVTEPAASTKPPVTISTANPTTVKTAAKDFVKVATITTTTTEKPTTTKRRSFIDRLLNRGGNAEKTTSTVSTPKVTTTKSTTTTKSDPFVESQAKQDSGITSTVIPTTTKSGFLKRIFGRKSDN